MKGQQLVVQARAELVAGKYGAANRSAWEAVQAAMIAQDETTVREAQTIARDVADLAEGSTRDEAEKLATYCAALLDGVGGGVRAPSLIDRLFSRRSTSDRRRCPRCAEDIAAAAKVCRYCGHELYPDPPAPSSPSG